MKLTRREAAGALTGALGIAQGGLHDNAHETPPATPREVHAVWAGAGDAGATVESVRAFVAQLKRANIHKVVIGSKQGDGSVVWHSRRFPQLVSPRYKDFDLVENLVREAHAEGIEVHIWLIDFLEGQDGAAFRQHPEWAQLNAEGKPTNSETLLNSEGLPIAPYRNIWMCPAQRPGYTDQWLLPLIEELVSSYAIDGIHHDYARYCGDVAPDSYCFCDYCLKNIPRHALLRWESGLTEPQHVEMARPRLEANWEATPDVLPPGWERMDRREKADFMLNGRTIAGGEPDMRYFFYEYRVDQVTRFVREAHARARRINPKIRMSAAVFKNPIQSGRYLGQKWSDWNPWIDIYMPMSYRSHFLGDFDTYCAHLTEVTARQLEWTYNERPLYAGIYTSDLYKEEAGTGTYPPAKLARAIEAARAAEPGGIAIFSAGSLQSQKLWPQLEEIFKEG
jgi:uncharacterized lipoprotein YddW (UPF0748 family)